MRDITLGDTFYHFFTTRAFATGVPTTLGGTPALSVLEENNATPITAGVSVQVDRASVTGLNQATIVATGGNGFETAKSYAIYISTGTVGGTSVVGEVVGEFTIQASAAAVDIANGVTIAVGGIGSTAFAAGAIDAAAIAADAITNSELAASAAQEIADEVLNRDLAGGGSGNTRNVRNALRALRNKVSESGGTLTVTIEDDTTTAWTATVVRTAATNPITSVDPT